MSGDELKVHGLEDIDEVGVTDFTMFVLFNVATSLYLSLNTIVPLLGNTLWVEEADDASILIDDELDMMRVECKRLLDGGLVSPLNTDNYIVKFAVSVRDMLKAGIEMESEADLVYAPVVRYSVPSGSGLPVVAHKANFMYAEVLL